MSTKFADFLFTVWLITVVIIILHNLLPDEPIKFEVSQ
jgi:hypothetical protein